MEQNNAIQQKKKGCFFINKKVDIYEKIYKNNNIKLSFKKKQILKPKKVFKFRN